MDDYIPMSEEMLAAKRCDDQDAIRRLLEHGENPNAEDEDREPLLGWAAWRGYLEIVRLLLDRGADIDTRGHEGDTPLINASGKGYADIVGLLIERGADVNLVERGGWTALLWAQTRGHEEIVGALLAAGALEDVSEMPEEKQREQEKLERYNHDLDLARQEFSSRAGNQTGARLWAGAWANPIGPGTATFVFHSDGTVMACSGDKAREVAHLDDPGDGTLSYRLQNAKATKIEKWWVSEDGSRLSLDYGDIIATFERL